MEGAPERKAKRRRSMTLRKLEYIEATQPSCMPRTRKKGSFGVVGAVEGDTTSLGRTHGTGGATARKEPQLTKAPIPERDETGGRVWRRGNEE
jgi:hypothetical protein